MTFTKLPSPFSDDHASRRIRTDTCESLLNTIHSPPPYVYIRGNESLLRADDQSALICIVGSRSHTEYGRIATKSIVEQLSHARAIGASTKSPVIVSGLALGIDTWALRYALDHGMPCIAVIGSGLDDASMYPQSNIALAHEILESGGLLVSEYPDGTKAKKWTFPARNRIMAGISHAIIIVEGSIRSGTLITARLGLEFNRDIVCVPGSIFSPQSEGPLSLIQQGAVPLARPEQILELLGMHHENIGSGAWPQYPNTPEIYSRCSADEQKLLDALQYAGIEKTKDELMAETGIAVSTLQIVLTMLEIKGLIAEKYGKIVRL